MAGRKSDFTLTKLDDLFSTQEQRDEEKLSKIRDIPLTEIDDFPDHPFKVRDDEDMAQLIESIKERGVITPATVRQKEDGRYELISGHRRKRACELAGFDTLRCEVVELNRDEATILMVESNYQRSQILPSEKAYAYKMRLEAIIDPEREYSQLVKALGGEIINISATSPSHINAMDMNKEYGDGANPVILKSEFIMSLCEQLIGGTNLGAKQKSIIDRCTASVYRDYQQRGYTGTVPTLQDFRAELLKQDEPEAKEIALAIELFTHGSLNTFAKPTNVDTDNRLICYDILDLGKQLMPIGMLVVLDSILNRITQNRAKGKQTFIFMSMQTVVQEINQEYDDRLEQEKNSVSYDVLEMSGSRAVWKEVLAVYSVKVNTDPDNPMEVATVDETKKQLLSDIFWKMNDISSRTESKNHTEIEESDDGHGNIVQTETTVTETFLYITVSHKTVDEMAAMYGFNQEQKDYLAELLQDENNQLWSQVLYGIGYSDDQIVTVALSQVGNVGGQPYWSWYGFDSRVEWCACFVSWCANECGYIDAGIIPKYAGCVNGVQWFRDRGQWADGSYEPSPGTIIFFDWEGDGVTDHTGIVQKCENGTVYTVEGNSGDTCRTKTYTVGSSVIYGYGIPAY